MHARPAPAASPPHARTAPRFPSWRIPLAMLAAAAVVSACGTASGGGGGQGGLGATAPLPAAVDSGLANLVSARLREPIEIRSVNGVLDVTLEVDTATLRVPRSWTEADFWNLKTYRLLAANGVSYADSGVVGFPGPTFRVRRGDRVRIQLINNLPPSSNDVCEPYPAVQSGVDVFQDCFHGPTWTNIHYHGMHVTPRAPGDDVLLMIAPGDTFQYDFVIPANQSPGTHWYHPHKHGSVALQVINGMSGAFIVDGGGLDSLTQQLGIREHMLGIQQIGQQVNLMGGTGSRQLINGQYRPILVMQANEVQRWRIVNENVNPTAQSRVGFIDVAGVDEPRVFDVARDGVQFAPANYDTLNVDSMLLMAPGNRLDVLVRAPSTPGLHRFQARQVGHLALRSPSRNPDAVIAAAAPPDTLFEVLVVPNDGSVATTLPATLPALPGFLGNLSTQQQMAVVVFSDSLPRDSTGRQQRRTATNPTRFFLGSAQDPYQKFDSERVFIPTSAVGDSMPMLLDSSQTWMVRNHSEVGVNHPFHIHINPFQVVGVHQPNASDPNAAFYAQLTAAAAAGNPIWLDVVPLPLARTDSLGNVLDPGYVVINQQYADFTGPYVMHCHILGHEERGMMQVIEVFDPSGQRVPPPTEHTGHGGHGAHAAHRGGNGAAHQH